MLFLVPRKLVCDPSSISDSFPKNIKYHVYQQKVVNVCNIWKEI
jgi:hypothetical protein